MGPSSTDGGSHVLSLLRKPTCAREDIHKKVLCSFVNKSRKLKISSSFIVLEMDRYIVIYSHKGIFHISQNKLITDVSVNMDKSKKHNAEWKNKLGITRFTKSRKSSLPISWKRKILQWTSLPFIKWGFAQRYIFLWEKKNKNNSQVLLVALAASSDPWTHVCGQGKEN